MEDIVEIHLKDLALPETERRGRLISMQGTLATVEVEGAAPLAPRSLVEFRTTQTMYLGEVELSTSSGSGFQLTIHIEYRLDVQKINRIQHSWVQDGA
jgi:hypothetical protein